MPVPKAGKYARRYSLRHHDLLLNDANQFLQPLALRAERTLAEGREPVIAAARVIQFRRGPFVGLLDQFCLDQALDRAIQCRRPQPHFSLRASQDFLHDSVAMLFPTRKREHDVKPLGLERDEFLRIGFFHTDSICILSNIYMSTTIYSAL